MVESVENKNLETMQNGPKENERPDFIVHNKFPKFRQMQPMRKPLAKSP